MLMRLLKRLRRTGLLSRVGVVALLACPAMTSMVSGAEQKPIVRGVAEETVTLNFVDVSIDAVVKVISEITRRNFLIDPRVKGTLTVISGKPVSISLAYNLLLSALRMQGYASVEHEGVTRIVPEVDAKTQAGPVTSSSGGSTNRDDPRGDQIVTRIFNLQHESAVVMAPVLRPLVAPNNTISAIASNNSLVITDYADNMTRLGVLIASLDKPNTEGPIVIPIRHASAIDLANMLNRLYGEAGNTAGANAAGGDIRQRATIVADTRANNLIIRSESQGTLAGIRNLLTSLDQPTAAAGNIHVVYLKNADATKMAQTLRAIMGAEAATMTASAATPGLSAAMPGLPMTMGGAPLAGGPISGRAGTGTFPTDSSSVSNTSRDGGAGLIQADSANNALIITAPEHVYNNLRRVIEMLDKRRAQVYVEALIVEVTAERASEFGIQWQEATAGGGGGAQLIGGTNFGSGGRNIIENAARAGVTGTLGIAPGFNIGVLFGKTAGGVPNLGVLARLLETEATANILSTPNILTLDNEEAKIVVGSNVPFITGQYAQTATGVSAPFQTYERRDVGLTLKIKPQITEGGIVRLNVFQEASSIQGTSLSNPAGPVTNKRSIESSIIVDDGGIIVIGGLIEDNYTVGEDKVPGLGDLPFFGGLFRYETRKRTKTNLMVFLRPQIIRDAKGYQGLTSDRYDYVIGEQQRTGINPRLMPGEPPVPALPAIGVSPRAPAIAPAPR